MDDSHARVETIALKERLTAEQVRIHITHLPAMIIAPSLGGLFSAWVLWGAVEDRYLVIGMALVFLVSALRALLYHWYRATPERRQYERKWRRLAILGALVSGIVWGSAAIFLYPPLDPDYLVYLVALLALIPVAPVAALAIYMPAFYAYYLPCIIPFLIVLLASGNRPEQLTALLLIMMSGATINFAREYAKTLNENLRLRLQLSDKKEALEKTARVKTHFLAAASHDLRQPVHAMGLFLETLRNRLREGEDLALLNHVESARLGLRGMLDEMLDISRLDAEVVKVNKCSFAVAGLLERLAQEYAPLASQKGLRFCRVIREAVVFSDPAQLERILRNLLDNALKYTERGGILLACRRRGERVLLQVYDTGRGIPPQCLDEIFQEFTQIDNPARDASRGLGLGLAIVDRLNRLLDHGLEVRSRVGRGSVFSLWVDAGRAADVASIAHGMVAPTSRPGRGEKLLVIDDDEAIRTGMAELLNQWGYQALAADSAETALALLQQPPTTPDLLLVDYRLADGDTALDAIGRLLQRLGVDIPAIIITGDTDPARIREAHDSGHLLLHKPLEANRLKLCVETLLGAPERQAGLSVRMG
ncbi:MAG TPA: hybrid sensor histidine kinase/response regulator [Thiotrichales bacterium]|nr:hybrid sensor histidine kinase/response regulator [Thiotrichales bacterium]